jgi:hypothetical protein
MQVNGHLHAVATLPPVPLEYVSVGPRDVLGYSVPTGILTPDHTDNAVPPPDIHAVTRDVPRTRSKCSNNAVSISAVYVSLPPNDVSRAASCWCPLIIGYARSGRIRQPTPRDCRETLLASSGRERERERERISHHYSRLRPLHDMTQWSTQASQVWRGWLSEVTGRSGVRPSACSLTLLPHDSVTTALADSPIRCQTLFLSLNNQPSFPPAAFTHRMCVDCPLAYR